MYRLDVSIECFDGRIDGCINRCVDGGIVGCIDGCIDGDVGYIDWMNRFDASMDGCIDWMYRWTYPQMY